MNHDQKLPAPSHSPSEDMQADGLSPEQKRFAQVIGRLLARLWDRECRSPEAPSAGNGSDPPPSPRRPGL